jgi:hypothetical protein
VEEVVSCIDFAADGRRAVSPTHDDQVMVVVHDGNLMFLHKALQVPVTHSE